MPTPPPSGLQLWLKADAGVTTSGSNVTAWADQSGNGHNFSTVTGTPVLLSGGSGINGLPAIRFNNTGGGTSTCYLSANIDPHTWTGITVLYVTRTVASGAIPEWSSVFGWQATGSWWAFNAGDNSDPTQALGWAGPGGGVSLGSTAGITNGQLVIEAYRYDKSAWDMSGTFTNGPVSDTSFPAGTVTALVGTNTYSSTQNNGDIAEILVWDHKLSDPDLATAMAYLNARYVAGPPPSIDPTTWGALPGDTVSFSASGGSGSGYVFTIAVNNSGGSIVDHGDGTATYTAGATSGVNDTVRLTDSSSGTSDGIVQVRSPLAVTPPTTVTVQVNAFYNFTATGGATQSFGLNWTITTDGSGGAVVNGSGTDSTIGQYQAGPNPGTDIVSVFDNDGNQVDCTVHVVAVGITPNPVTVPPLGSQLFTAVPGSPPYTFTYTLNNSDGSLIDNGDGTASYTAGQFPDCIDTVRVTDNDGNVADATINVGHGVSTTPGTGVHVNPGASQVFTAHGGSGTGYSFTPTFFSGGSLVDHGDGTATYTAGTTSNTSDDITVVDSLGNQFEFFVFVPGPQLTPANPTTAFPHQVIAFSVSGGVAPWTITLPINNSGGSLVDHGDGTATYTAGATGNVNDVVQVDDVGGNGYFTLVQVGPALTISPSVSTVPPGGSETFTHTGGGAPFTYSLHVNNSGGSVNATTGVYTAGHTGGVNDTVRVTDTNGATADATVHVSASLAIMPSSFECNAGQGHTFGATGGSGTGFGFALTTNNSGGSVNATTGAYVSGTLGTVDVTDVIQLHDSLGNTASATILVHPPQPPTFFLRQVAPMGMSTIRVTFSHAPRAADPTDPTDALNPDNYTLTGPVIDYIVRVTEVVGDPNSVDCSLGAPMKPGSWSLSARNIKDSNGIETI